MLKKILTTLLFFSLTSPLLAGNVSARLRTLSPVNDTYANLTLAVVVEFPGHPCATSQAFSFDKTTQHGTQMYYTLLQAITNDKTVRIYYSDTECGLFGNQALVHRVAINSN